MLIFSFFPQYPILMPEIGFPAGKDLYMCRSIGFSIIQRTDICMLQTLRTTLEVHGQLVGLSNIFWAFAFWACYSILKKQTILAYLL